MTNHDRNLRGGGKKHTRKSVLLPLLSPRWLTRGRVAGLLLSVRAGVLPRKFQRDLQPDRRNPKETLPEPRKSPHGEYG